MEKFNSQVIPSRVIECVRLTRQHYYDYLISELTECQKSVNYHNKGTTNTREHWKIMTDSEQGNTGARDVLIKLINNEIDFDKAYRQDICVLKSETRQENILCWPVVHDIVSYSLVDDFPKYPQCSFSINTTTIELNSFCWFSCDIEFYPNADRVEGLIYMWFSKWFYPRKNISSPFLNVLHKIDGPFREQEGCELYWIDFGTAPSAAFYDLLDLICRKDVKKLVIK